MNPAPVYAPLKGSAQPLESLRDVPLRDLEDVEASMLRVTASSLMGFHAQRREIFFHPLMPFSKLSKAGDTFQEWFLRGLAHSFGIVAA